MDCFNFITHKNNKAFPVFLSLTFLLLLSFYVISNSFVGSSKNPVLQNFHETTTSIGSCSGVRELSDYESKCKYVRSHSECWGDGYLNYHEIFYCNCGNMQVLGYVILILWLVLLFYVLGNTTAEYFCPSVEGLSRVLKLSPTIAGTTLLPLGNGANDVFSSIISFTGGSSDGDVGLNCVLGGAFFISCFVVGILSISISSRGIRVDEGSFIRDVVFFLFALCCLLGIIMVGEVNIWFALGFILIYFLYIAVVSIMQLYFSKGERVVNPPLIDAFDETKIPLLGYLDEEKGKDSFQILDQPSKMGFRGLVLYIIELPLSLPRRVTIPVVSEENWSKPFAVASSTLGPILISILWNTQGKHNDFKTSLVIYFSAMFIGIVLGILALIFTRSSTPPNKFLLPWLAGGFLMSIIWTYIIAEELVSLLVAFGNILGISPSILGLTVLAWGNSVGDLISNLSMALKGGADGTQVAMSGCYAGPLFNTLVGLGLSLVFAAWKEYPSGYVITGNSDLYEIIGFLMMGLLWALVILPKRNMEIDKFLGVGLLSIYFCFLSLRLVKCVGLVKL